MQIFPPLLPLFLPYHPIITNRLYYLKAQHKAVNLKFKNLNKMELMNRLQNEHNNKNNLTSILNFKPF